MGNSNHIAAIAEFSESEGVFTTAQAGRMGIPRDALHDAVQSGRLDRIIRGAYRMVGSGSSYLDEFVAAWKLTAPSKFTHERMSISGWDGVVVGGHTAVSLLGFGDFQLFTYRIYAPKRINARSDSVHFAKRNVLREEAMLSQGASRLKTRTNDIRSRSGRRRSVARCGCASGCRFEGSGF